MSMRKKLAGVREFEYVVLAAILLNHFSFWPSIVLDSTNSTALELSMLSGLTVVVYVAWRAFKEFVSFLATYQPARWLFAWFAYGSSITLLLTDNLAPNVLRIGYLGSAIIMCTTLIFLIKTKRIRLHIILYGWVLFALVLAALSIVQFVFAATGNGFIKTPYAVGVFAFPRVHAFSFEPLFFAHWLLTPFLFSLYAASVQKLHFFVPLSISVSFFLTLSRGAFFGATAGIVLLLVFGKLTRQGIARTLAIPLAGVVIALTLVGVSAQHNNSSFSKGIGRYLDHATLGVFNKSGSENVSATQVVSDTGEVTETYIQITGLDTEGVVEGSTKSRVEASQGALEIYTDTPQNIVFGIGFFRFGEEANIEEPEVFWSQNHLTNNQLLDIVVETGTVGLFLLSWLLYSVRRSLRSAPLLAWVFLVALTVQFLTFSALFLIPFWVIVAFLLGSDKKTRVL